MKMMIAVLALASLPLQAISGGTENSGRQTRGALISAAMSGGFLPPGRGRADFVHWVIVTYPPNPCSVHTPNPGPPDCPTDIGPDG